MTSPTPRSCPTAISSSSSAASILPMASACASAGSPATISRPGATVDGDVLLEADMRYQIDNMEGLAVHTNADGETIIALVSDNNHNMLQRTLLLFFALAPDPAAAAPRTERTAAVTRTTGTAIRRRKRRGTRRRSWRDLRLAGVASTRFSIWRFKRRALIDSSLSRAASRNLSRPPRCSTERSACEVILQVHPLAERVADQRDLVEVGQETPTRLVVRVADVVAGQDCLSGQFATPGHSANSLVLAGCESVSGAGLACRKSRTL